MVVDNGVARFRALFVRVTGRSSDQIEMTADTRPLQEFAIDSIAAVSLMFLVEDEFKVDLAGDRAELEKLETIGQLLEFISAKGGH